MKPTWRQGCCVLLLATGLASAQDRADIDRTAIIGNRELPKVLYIVPWKKPLPATLNGRPVHSVLDEALAPVDRAVFRRELAYSQQLRLGAASPPALPSSPTAPAAPLPVPTPAPAGAPR